VCSGQHVACLLLTATSAMLAHLGHQLMLFANFARPSLCMLLESVASWPRTIAPRASGNSGNFIVPRPLLAAWKLIFPPTALCTKTCSWPADTFRFFAGYILSALLAMHSLYRLTVEPATSLFGPKEKTFCVRTEFLVPGSLSSAIFMTLAVC